MVLRLTIDDPQGRHLRVLSNETTRRRRLTGPDETISAGDWAAVVHRRRGALAATTGSDKGRPCGPLARGASRAGDLSGSERIVALAPASRAAAPAPPCRRRGFYLQQSDPAYNPAYNPARGACVRDELGLRLAGVAALAAFQTSLHLASIECVGVGRGHLHVGCRDGGIEPSCLIHAAGTSTSRTIAHHCAPL